MSTNTCSHIDLEDRWILVREIDSGYNRFFVSEAFERDVATFDQIVQTYDKNACEIHTLWIPNQPARERIADSLVYQVAMRQSPLVDLPPCRVNNAKIRLRFGNEVLVDAIVCYHIVSLDKAFFYTEYIPQERCIQNAMAQATIGDSSLRKRPVNHSEVLLETKKQKVGVPDDDLGNDLDILFDDLPEFGGFGLLEDWLDGFQFQ